MYSGIPSVFMLERLLQQNYHLQELFHFQAKLFFHLKWIPMKRKDLTVAKKVLLSKNLKVVQQCEVFTKKTLVGSWILSQ